MWPFKKKKSYVDLTKDPLPEVPRRPSFSATLPQDKLEDVNRKLDSIEQRIIEMTERIKVIEERLGTQRQIRRPENKGLRW